MKILSLRYLFLPRFTAGRTPISLISFVVWLLGSAALLSNSLAQGQNLAASGTGILGRKPDLDSGVETEIPVFNSGTAENINDGNANTRVDTYGRAGDVSFVGILWDQPISTPVVYLDLTLALFSNGGWFGVPNVGPVEGGPLTDEHLVEPRVEVTTDGGQSWTVVEHSSDYLTKLTGQKIGGGGQPNPNPASVTFTLNQPARDIDGIRIIGLNGGTVGGGFLGIFELGARPSDFPDTDADGMDDNWERDHGLNVGTNDSAADPDGDGLANIQEFRLKTDPHAADSDNDGLKDGQEVNVAHTDPLRADTDGDGLSDGDELNVHHTNPLRVDSDGDGLTDSDELNVYHTNPLAKDTDGDGFLDGMEITEGSDPNSASSAPSNIAPLGHGILGVKSDFDAGIEGETPVFNSGTAVNINDDNLSTRVDTYSGPPALSFVGILWDQAITKPILDLELTLALFSNGGWFGPNGIDPGAGGKLTPDYLIEPRVEVTSDGGTSWTQVVATSDYLNVLNDHAIGGGGQPNPNPATAKFTLAQPAQNINGIRLIGEDGGSAGGGFLGVFELAAHTTGADSDGDGIDDAWERTHGLTVGVNDANGDPDADGLTNLQEFKLNTDPQLADSDGDGLKDGDEQNTHHTDPLKKDTDGDGLSDGAEVNVNHTNPLLKDSDGDGFSDGAEIAEGSDPNSAASVPRNIASLGQGILGTKPDFDSGTESEVPISNAGGTASINDGNLATRVDTYGGAPSLSYVGIVWTDPVKKPITDLQLTLALFSNGGWFGPNGTDPGPGGNLTDDYLIEPRVEVTSDDGTTWTSVDATSDYLNVLRGHPIGGGAQPNPNPATVKFTLAQPIKDINGIRLIGSDGGSVGEGFLGVFELAVNTQAGPTQGPTLINVGVTGAKFHFDFDTQSGVNYVVEVKNALTDANWQTYKTVPGDGNRAQITYDLAGTQRVFRITHQ
jgi:hypothetical protein